MKFPLVAWIAAMALPLVASAVEIPGNEWMKGLPDATPISQISIPGAHDAGARFEPFPGTAKCQDLTIPEQLEAGVRFLDIRCRHVGDAFLIHHGAVYQNLDFDGVLGKVRGFLKAHPSETVILSIKEEFQATNNTRTFPQTFDAYVAKNAGQWVLGTDLPPLGKVRGKGVLFRRFPDPVAKGIDASRWPDSATFRAGSLRVQDVYKAKTAEAKWGVFEPMLGEASAGKPETLFVNFSSAVGTLLGVPTISAMADPMNGRLTTYFTEHRRGHYGVLVMDFANAARCRLVYETNFDR